MSRTTPSNGRLCNQIFRNIAISVVAKKFELKVDYSSFQSFEILGINLYSGKFQYENTEEITDDNYFKILNRDTIDFNLNSDSNYFQTKEISHLIYNFLNNKENKQSITQSNLYKEKYNNNNDLFIHVRLGDVISKNPGFDYYKNAIEKVINKNGVVKNVFISSDSLEHDLVEKIINFIKINFKVESIDKINKDEVHTIMFASTCKNIILSQGTFSAIIGYLSYYSKIYYPKIKIICHGDIFSINGWNEVNY
jgi:hypothetical protein